MSLSYNHRNKSNFSKLDNRYLFISFLPILSLIVGFIIFINNRSEQLKLNKIPSIEKNIKILNDQKIIALKIKMILLEITLKIKQKKWND